MRKPKIEEVVEDIALPIVSSKGFELVEVEFKREGHHWYLRVFIDKPGGIIIDDCQAVSEELSEALDQKDPIDQSYFLEVSSPGIDRPLKKERDFERHKGQLVEVKLYKALNGTKVYEGELVGLMEGKIVIIDQGGNHLSFSAEDVSLVRLSVKF